MQLTGKITPDSLMTLEAYAKWRKVHKPEVMAHRKLPLMWWTRTQKGTNT